MPDVAAGERTGRDGIRAGDRASILLGAAIGHSPCSLVCERLGSAGAGSPWS